MHAGVVVLMLDTKMEPAIAKDMLRVRSEALHNTSVNEICSTRSTSAKQRLDGCCMNLASSKPGPPGLRVTVQSCCSCSVVLPKVTIAQFVTLVPCAGRRGPAVERIPAGLCAAAGADPQRGRRSRDAAGRLLPPVPAAARPTRPPLCHCRQGAAIKHRCKIRAGTASVFQRILPAAQLSITAKGVASTAIATWLQWCVNNNIVATSDGQLDLVAIDKSRLVFMLNRKR